ncbi:hypothetical protein PHYBLDRAFT_168883 [Phycomyces blakesleeanus NRRL 1555(-)]|uniref:Uncharacterized protein n=1 Tax=Phycomyces blakesleeanus (strain ATCC 8743b / DSM 1359 / FGSC 10004 / NBRC 33097 / NRRL 1555) TaxID=763407 RepID=A0A167MQF6_PHYB8|nr:hypothetical protein PHYBLDRAFT_168883 [Phycomyces blakesleeanus NRRL 1555(-)]OAD73539.1 hypothetical protein PHYBLDRAFT_168883 [Phycomyces blakesleeanus NRRL 1555(-)]|eukprot:XP_018291579.1 hypothetical protein PHYBLDRAFT_168883 [Phycomyces blakesleeanus NRRL 1555(-)]
MSLSFFHLNIPRARQHQLSGRIKMSPLTKKYRPPKLRVHTVQAIQAVHKKSYEKILIESNNYLMLSTVLVMWELDITTLLGISKLKQVKRSADDANIDEEEPENTQLVSQDEERFKNTMDFFQRYKETRNRMNWRGCHDMLKKQILLFFTFFVHIS